MLMRITLANMKKKKVRTVLVILSILLSSALMYAILSLSQTTTGMFEKMFKKEIGSAEIGLRVQEDSKEQLLDPLNFDSIDGIEYSHPILMAFGFGHIEDKKIAVTYTGMNLENYKSIYPFKILQGKESLKDNEVIIGQEVAETYKLTVGDKLEVNLNGTLQTYKVGAIVEDANNNLGYQTDVLDVLIDLPTLQEQLGVNDKVSNYAIKTAEGYSVKEMIKVLSDKYSNYSVKEAFSSEDFTRMMNQIIIPLMIMVISVILVSTFIIYSSFKIIAIERMPLMGTLRSIGATKNMTIKTMLYESTIYGVIGGVLGNLLGIGILNLTVKMIFKGSDIDMSSISYMNPKFHIIAFAMAILLSVGSSMIPIIKTAGKSIRSIIFGEIQNEKHVSFVKACIGLVMVGSGFWVYNVAPVQYEMPLSFAATLVITVGGALVIPLIAYALTFILQILFRPFAGDKMDFVATNLKNDRTLMNNIVLLSMGLAVILMINNMSSSVATAVLDVYSKGKADALVMGYEMDQAFIDGVIDLDGVDHVYTTTIIQDVKSNNEVVIPLLEGMDGQGYTEYAWDEFGKYLTDDLMETFHSERSIILSHFIAKKYDLQKGDMLYLTLNDKEVAYEVIEIVPTIMNNGNMCFVYEDFLREDSGVTNYHSLYINVKPGYITSDVIQDVKERMPYGIVPMISLKEMQDRNIEANKSMFGLMKAISIIAMFIGTVGVFNNYIVSFLSRRRFVATMRSLGLGRGKMFRLFMLEALTCGSIGATTGIVFGTVMVKGANYLVETIGITSDVIGYNVKDYIFVFVSGIILALISAVLPALSMSRENIVSQIKYE